MKYRYLIIRSQNPPDCYLQMLQWYMLAGLRAMVHTPRFVAIYDDVLVVGVARDVVRVARAVVALMENCRTVKVAGTAKRAKSIAASIRTPRLTASRV